MNTRKDNDDREPSGLVHISGLWKNKSKSGQGYLGGSVDGGRLLGLLSADQVLGLLGGARVLVFQNKSKKTDKDPDMNLYVAPRNGPGAKKAEPVAAGVEDDPTADW